MGPVVSSKYADCRPAATRALRDPNGLTPLLQTKFDEINDRPRPDGRWLAYDSNSFGIFEIYVFSHFRTRRRPVGNSRRAGGGTAWARTGTEL